jgi:heptosyltransferase-2
MTKRSTPEVHRRLRGALRRQTWPAAAHQVHEYLRLVQAVGASGEELPPTLRVAEETVRATVGKFGLAGPLPGARPLFALNPGAEYGPAKRWPADRFAATAIAVHERARCVWLLTGGAGDISTAASIEQKLSRAGAPVINLAGKTSLGELCCLFKLCSLVLTNDTGPMHVAAALGLPVIVPFGSTAPELTGPGLPGDPKHQLLSAPEVGCAPCFRRTCPVELQCLRALSVARVTEAVLAAASGLSVRPLAD